MGSEPQLGTGQGVSHHQLAREDRVEALAKWAAKPVLAPGGGEDAAAVAASVPSLADLTSGPSRAGTAKQFADLAEGSWRSFRVKLDQCVHYAECRICELVTLLT